MMGVLVLYCGICGEFVAFVENCREIVFQVVLEFAPEEQWVVHNSWGPIYMINELVLE